MPYKIPDTPAISSSVCELADYLELQCLLVGDEYSILTAHKQISLPSDEVDGEEDSSLMDRLELALGEIELRDKYCNGRYPFFTKNRSVMLKEFGEEHELDSRVYFYLLLATRLNMTDRKMANGVDGALLFERLSSLVAQQYFGNKAQTFVFGTGTKGGFQEKIPMLAKEMEEGGGYKDPEGSSHREKDGGLDIVVWKPFSDRKKGKLIGFGQCKTGTDWRNQVWTTTPDDFCKTFFSIQPYVEPVKLFFVAEQFYQDRERIHRRGGVFFDRCRMMEFLPMPTDIPANLCNDMDVWFEENMKYVREKYGCD